MLARATRQGDVPVPGKIGRHGQRALFPGQVYDLPEEVIEEADWLVPLPPAGGESAGSDEAPPEDTTSDDGEATEPEAQDADEEEPKPRRTRRRTPKGG